METIETPKVENYKGWLLKPDFIYGGTNAGRADWVVFPPHDDQGKLYPYQHRSTIVAAIDEIETENPY